MNRALLEEMLEGRRRMLPAFALRICDAASSHTWTSPSEGDVVIRLARRMYEAVRAEDYPTATTVCEELSEILGEVRKSGREAPLRNDLMQFENQLYSLMAGPGLMSRAPGDAHQADAVAVTHLRRGARIAAELSVRLLPPAQRQRYREEFAAELADVDPKDRAAYSYRLFSRAWFLRRALKGAPRRLPVAVIVVSEIASPGIAGAVVTAIAGGPAVYIAGVLVAGCLAMVGWTIFSTDRTERLATLIKAARGEEPDDGGVTPRKRRS